MASPPRRTTRSMSKSHPRPRPRTPSRGRSLSRSPFRSPYVGTTIISTKGYKDDIFSDNEEEGEIPSPTKKPVQPPRKDSLPQSPFQEEVTFGDENGDPILPEDQDNEEEDLEQDLLHFQQKQEALLANIKQEEVRIQQERNNKLRNLHKKETIEKILHVEAANKDLLARLNKLRNITETPIKEESDIGNPDEDPEDDPSSHRGGPSPPGRRSPFNWPPIYPSFPPPSNLKVSPPEKYDGSPKIPVADWLFLVDQYFKTAKARDEEKADYASTLL